jgi:hypothetical protein
MQSCVACSVTRRVTLTRRPSPLQPGRNQLPEGAGAGVPAACSDDHRRTPMQCAFLTRAAPVRPSFAERALVARRRLPADQQRRQRAARVRRA